MFKTIFARFMEIKVMLHFSHYRVMSWLPFQNHFIAFVSFGSYHLFLLSYHLAWKDHFSYLPIMSENEKSQQNKKQKCTNNSMCDNKFGNSPRKNLFIPLSYLNRKMKTIGTNLLYRYKPSNVYKSVNKFLYVLSKHL